MFSKATIKERRQYYREEWDPKDLPGFISKDIKKREFGFDHNGRGPNDRYKVFGGTESLRKFLRYKAPFAAYISVAFYNNPRRREDWLKAEYIFDVDAKDIPIRSCQCDGVCEICLGEALEIVNNLIDTLEGDLGLKDIHLIYSGRGYHIRIMDEEMMTAGSDLRSEVLKYAAGAEVPKSQFMNSEVSSQSFNFEHFTIPVGYQKIFTDRVKFNIQHMVGNAFPLFHRRLGSADIHFFINLHRIAGDDFTVHCLSKLYRKCCFTGGGRACNTNDVVHNIPDCGAHSR